MPRSSPASASAAACVDERAEVAVGVEPQVRRRHDLGTGRGRSSAQWSAQHLALACELLDAARRAVPVLRAAGDGAQRALLAAAADADRRVRPLHRLRLAAGGRQLVVLAVEVGGLVGEQPDDHLERLVEAVEALLERRQLDAVGVALLLVPAGAEAELEAAVRRRCRGWPPCWPARPGAGRRCRSPARRRRSRVVAWASAVVRDPALEARAGRVGEDRIEVVERPARLEEVDVVGRPPDGEHVGPGRVLRRGLEGEAPCRSSTPEGPWWA